MTRCGREGHTRPRGPLETPDGVWGPEKMLIRCHKESQHPAEWALGLRLNIRRTRKTQHDGHNSGVKIWSLCSVSSTLSHANLEQPFRTLAIKWEVNIFLKKSSCIFLPASLSCVVYSCICLWYCVVVMLNDDVDDYITHPTKPKHYCIVWNQNRTENMCYNQTGDISTLEGTPLKLVDKFTY